MHSGNEGIVKYEYWRRPVTHGYSGEVLQSGNLRLFRGLPTHGDTVESGAPVAAMALPMKILGQVVGVFTFRTNHSDGFAKDDLNFAQQAMALCATAVFKRQMEQAAPEQTSDRFIDVVN